MVLDALVLRMGQVEYGWNSGSIERVELCTILKEVDQQRETTNKNKKRKEKKKKKVARRVLHKWDGAVSKRERRASTRAMPSHIVEPCPECIGPFHLYCLFFYFAGLGVHPAQIYIIETNGLTT